MAYKPNFDILSKNHSINFITDKLYMLKDVRCGRVSHRWVYRDIEAVELYHFFNAPDSDFAVERGRHEQGVFSFDGSQWSNLPWVTFELMDCSSTTQSLVGVFSLINLNLRCFRLSELHKFSQPNVTHVVSCYEELLISENQNVCDVILFDFNVIVFCKDFTLLVLFTTV